MFNKIQNKQITELDFKKFNTENDLDLLINNYILEFSKNSSLTI